MYHIKLCAFLLAIGLANLATAQETKVFETKTTEVRGISGWLDYADSCDYAIADAKRKASRECKINKEGELVSFINKQGEEPVKIVEECKGCDLNTLTGEWHCTARVITQCEYWADVPSASLVDQMRGAAQGKPYTETNNPCTKDTQTRACMAYRDDLKKQGASGVR